MEEVIKYRWGALPDAQREGIKTYISNLIIKLCTDEGSFRREHTFLNKMNMILVQILKQVRPVTRLASRTLRNAKEGEPQRRLRGPSRRTLPYGLGPGA